MSIILDRWRPIVFCFILACIFGSLLLATSFLYENWFPLDNAIFQIIGRGWVEGKIPYVDLWDQKGPLIYFINALGYWLTGNQTGIFLIEILMFAWSFILIFLFYRRWYNSLWATMLLVITMFHLSQIVEGGNMVEEYILPLLLLAFFHIWNWADCAITKQKIEHPSKAAFLYGFILSASLLTRLTNTIGICLAICVILCCLIYYKKWRNLIENVLTFLTGFFVLALPFIIYFYCNNGLYEMIYGTLIFNYEYLNNSVREPFTWYAIISTLLAYVGTYGLAVVSLILVVIDKNYRNFHMMWLLISSVTSFYFLNTFLFGHYAIIAVPYFAIMIVESKRLFHLCLEKKEIQLLLRGCALLFVFVMLSNGGYQFSQTLDNRNLSDDNSFEKEILPIVGDKKSDLVCYNLFPSYYLRYQITPECRFFALQGWYASFSESIRPMIKESFEQKPPAFLLINGSSSETLIKDFLENKYKPICETSLGTLFKRNY